MSDMRNEAKSREDDKVSVWELITLRDRDWKIPLFISISVNMGQQLSGINAVSLDPIIILACQVVAITIIDTSITMIVGSNPTSKSETVITPSMRNISKLQQFERGFESHC